MGWLRGTTAPCDLRAEAAGQGETLRFDQLKAGQSATVVEVTSESPNAVRLLEMGLSIGAVFKVVEVAPFGDPIQICLRGYRLCLRKREAKELVVRLVDTECECEPPR